MEKIVLFLDYSILNFPSKLRRLYYSLKSRSIILKHNLYVSKNIKQIIKSKNHLKIICFDAQSERFLSYLNVDYSKIEDYNNKILDKQSSEDAMQIVKSMKKTDEFFSSSIDYKGISLWSIEEVDTWGSFLKNITKNINLIDAALKREKPDKVIILDMLQATSNIISDLCIKHDIRLETICTNNNLFSKFHDYFKPIIAKIISFHNITKFPIQNIIKNHLNFTKKKRILIIKDVLEPVEPTKTLYNELSEKYDVLFVSIDNAKKTYSDLICSNLSEYTSKKSFDAFKRNKEFFIRAFDTLKKSDFTNKINYNGADLWPLLKDMFLFYYYSRFPDLSYLIEIMNSLFKTEKPDLVILFDDIGVFGKTAAFVCKLNRVKCLTLQHGIFGDLPIMNIVSDKFAAYGDFIKKIMVKRGVSPKKIVVTGNPKFDIFLKNNYSRDKFYEKFGIPDDYKLVVLATTTFFLGNTNEDIISATIECLKNLDKTQLIIKTHPSDNNTPIYKSIVKKLNSDAIVIQKHDIFDILNSCDILITVSSTVGLEAMIFGKTVINLNLTGSEELIPYSKSKAAIGIRDLSKLAAAINNSLYNKTILKKLEHNKIKFIKEHAFKIDGKSTDRILSLVDNMVIK